LALGTDESIVFDRRCGGGLHPVVGDHPSRDHDFAAPAALGSLELRLKSTVIEREKKKLYACLGQKNPE